MYQYAYMPETTSVVDCKSDLSRFGLESAWERCDRAWRGHCLRRPLSMLTFDTLSGLGMWLQAPTHGIFATSLYTPASWKLVQELAAQAPVLNVSLFGEEPEHVRFAALRGVD